MERILVADDDFLTRKAMGRLLESAGFEVTVVADGSYAFDLMQQEEFSCVVTDGRMPIMNGVELAQRVARCYPQTPVIMVTGNKELAKGTPAFCMEKPINFTQLLAIVALVTSE